MRTHIELIQLVVAYALAGAFVFTLVATCMSLLGWVRFAVAAQQKKLFSVLIIELAVVAVGFFGRFLRFDVANVQEQVIRDYMSAPGTRALASDFRESDFSQSNFSGGRFEYTLFDRTSFRNARFQDADFSGADLSSVVVDHDTKLPTPAQ
jgi:uncharacterized protein YjbI with pentapeptide repeats